MSADLINPTGVDFGGLQVDDPAIQGFLALLDNDIQNGQAPIELVRQPRTSHGGGIFQGSCRVR
jgi:hypothetical protein